MRDKKSCHIVTNKLIDNDLSTILLRKLFFLKVNLAVCLPYPAVGLNRPARVPGNFGVGVLDPFAGTSTTLEASYREGFSSVGIESHPDYVETSRQRIARLLKAGRNLI